jgi:hypothetical protein
MRKVFVALLAAALLALGLATTTASAAAPPPLGHPGCKGLEIALQSHLNGRFFGDSPSGNPNASVGPGAFIRVTGLTFPVVEWVRDTQGICEPRR